ncbi:protein phosphatase CheZ [Pseudoalteromonas sp. SSDWG2]|uniref:protein phosphatase CheZ n=1 Tax=Pseudoalteromonas sp. SSDWG2 TaxID=3139391 RepID=UPI003BADA451
MSAPAAPHITLEQAKQLVTFLEQGEQEKADQLILDAASKEQSELFAEVGKLTRQLHESLKNFQLDTRINDLTQEAIPDAKQRLNYVIEMTEQAANKTMDAVEASLPIAEQLSTDLHQIKPSWDKLMRRDLDIGEFKQLCHLLDGFMTRSQTSTLELHDLLNNVLMAQDYQDLTGQVIRRVMELVREVEDSLIHMLKVFSGEDVDVNTAERNKPTTPVEGEGAEGPIIDSEARDDVVSGQDEVDDLLSSLGF